MKRMVALALILGLFLGGPPPAHAQLAGKVYRIGFLTWGGTAKSFKPRLEALRQGLRELGYMEGKNLVILDRYGEGHRERLPGLARDLVGLAPDVIVTHGAGASRAADRAARAGGRAIPVVFAVSADPVGTGLVASLARPGGNITGLSDSHSILVAKRLELLKKVSRSFARVAVIANPTSPLGSRQLVSLRAAARALGVTILPVTLAKPEDLEAAFATIGGERPDALDVLGYSLIAKFRRQIAAFALERRLPTITTSQSGPQAGFLLGYGVNHQDLYRRAATFVDKILKGAKPAELPVEQPTRFYLTVNLKTARALGASIPRDVLLRADEVIE